MQTANSAESAASSIPPDSKGPITAMGSQQRVDRIAFEQRMRSLGAIEAIPHIAVGCSGGADSMALTLLLNDWSRQRGGRTTALIVDHRLRTGSTTEARQVGNWLAARKIEFRILRRPGFPISSNIQAQARMARYNLLTSWCRQAGVLHLALAHQLEDQVETFLLRLARGSGVDGLAAMANILEMSDVRLLRPLIDVPRDRLIVTLKCFQQPYIEDPSNYNTKFARVRARLLSPRLAKEGITSVRLFATTERLGRARAALEDAVTSLAARCVSPRSEGYCIVNVDPLANVPEEIRLRLFGRILTCISGSMYPPRLHKLERLSVWLRDGTVDGGRTLGGCRVIWWKKNLLICREAAAVKDVLPMSRDLLWDKRFRLNTTFSRKIMKDIMVRRLGTAGWRQIVSARPAIRNNMLPSVVRLTLPALWALDEVVMVPHLKYVHEAWVPRIRKVPVFNFMPSQPIGSARFAFASGNFRGIL